MNKPVVCGRFNFFSFKPDEYHVIFTPRDSDLMIYIAKYLTREQMEILRGDLNDCLDEFRDFQYRTTTDEEKE